MGWMRTLRLGDIGNRRDIADSESDIRALRNKHWEGAKGLDEKTREIDQLQNELGRQTLAIQALTRFLISKSIVKEEELARFITEIDAEDGTMDGKITAAPTRAHPIPQPPLVNIPPGTYRKSEEQGPG
jgi:hypothetical protein